MQSRCAAGTARTLPRVHGQGRGNAVETGPEPVPATGHGQETNLPAPARWSPPQISCAASRERKRKRKRNWNGNKESESISVRTEKQASTSPGKPHGKTSIDPIYTHKKTGMTIFLEQCTEKRISTRSRQSHQKTSIDLFLETLYELHNCYQYILCIIPS